MVQVKNLIEMMRIATELSSRVAIGAHDNAITLQESLPKAFVALALFLQIQGKSI